MCQCYCFLFGLIFENEMLLQAENCGDAEIIFSFLEANEIGKSHAVYYISYALHLESKNKMKLANEFYNLGISR
jgi:checkpoint serine/threonine-protein kinase